MDHQVVGEIYAGCYRRLAARVYAVTGDIAEAEEVVQEAFVKALAAPRRFAAIDNPEAWLFRVAVNAALTRQRRHRVFERILRRIGVPPILPDHSTDHLALMSALRQLPDGQRYVLALHYLVDLSVEETAQILGISVGTVKSRLSRGRAALAGLVGEAEVARTGGSDHA